MKKFIKHFIREIMIISLSLILLINTFTQSDKKKEFESQLIENKKLRKQSDSLKVINDSLTFDKIVMEMELFRHELTRDEIFLKYPKVGEEYQYYISHYTE
jgi:hypothetical protein